MEERNLELGTLGKVLVWTSRAAHSAKTLFSDCPIVPCGPIVLLKLSWGDECLWGGAKGGGLERSLGDVEQGACVLLLFCLFCS